MNENDDISKEKCVSAEIFPPSDWAGLDNRARAVMLFPSGRVKIIVVWFNHGPNPFTEEELVGLTREQADRLYRKKEKAALKG